MRKAFKILLLQLLLYLISALANAQDKQLDSLKNALRLATADSAKFVALSGLADYYGEKDRIKTIYYVDRALPIAKRNNKLLDEATLLEFKGYEIYHLGKYAEAFENLQRSVEILEDPKNESNSWGQDKNQSPHKFRLFSLALTHLVMGHLQGKTNNTDQQIAEYKMTIKIATETGDYTSLGLACMNLGDVYEGMNKTDSALMLEKKAELSYKQAGYFIYLGSVYDIMGDIALRKGNNAEALQLYHKALNTSISTHTFSHEQIVYDKLTRYFLTLQQKDSSLYYAKKNLSAAYAIKSKNIGNAYETLYKTYQLNGLTDSAYKYQGLALTARDSSNKTDLKNLADFQKLFMQTQLSLQKLQKEKEEAQSRIRTYALIAIIVVVMIVAVFIYRNSRQRKKANYLLQKQKEEIATQRDNLEQALEDLKNTQTQLVQREKMASLGELTAGIAHEIQNPLNFVNNFSEVSAEMIDEMDEELDKGDVTEAKAIAADIKQNLEKIRHHGKRADSIVKGMLEHSRVGTGEKQLVDLNLIADEYLKLSYHGLRAKDKLFNAELITNFDEHLPKVILSKHDIGRVLLNLFNNAFYAVNQKQKNVGADYKPQVTVTTSTEKNNLVISVKDNGNGIPDAIKDKIMQPFFTTKPTGEGTGLGLSLSYDIVMKGHGGDITVVSTEGQGSEFKVWLPLVTA